MRAAQPEHATGPVRAQRSQGPADPPSGRSSAAGSSAAGDPSEGPATTSRDTANLPPTKLPPTSLPPAGGRQVLGAVGRRLRPQLPRVIGSLLVLLASAGCGLVMPLVLGVVVDAVTGKVSEHPLIGDGDPWRVLTVLLVALVLGSALNGIGTAWSAGAADRVVASLREDAVGAALTLDQERAEALGSGEVVSRSSDDVAAVTSAVNTALPSAIAAVTGVVVTVAGMAGIHWAFALVLVVVTVPVYAWTVRRYLRQAPPLYRAERAQRAARAGVVLDAVRGGSVVRRFRAEGFVRRRLVVPSWLVSRLVVLTQIATTRLFGGVNLAEFLGLAALLGTTFVLLGTGAVTLGAATTAVLFFLRLYDPIGTALMMLDQLQSAYTSLGRIVALVGVGGADGAAGGSARPSADGNDDARGRAAASGPRRAARSAEAARPDEVLASSAPAGVVSADPAPADAPSEVPAVVVRELDVHYGPRRAVAGVSFEVARGTNVALVGASGAGKSTVAAVVAGVRTPTRGSVRVAGQDPHALPPAERARVVALVSQENHVFAGTLRENLTLAAPAAGDDAVREALRAVGLAEWAGQLSDGLDTRVPQEGLGDLRRQLLALARVALLAPEVVVLDEPVSRAARGEAEILARAVAAVCRECTAITVIHHLDQAALCDRILVMERGAVVEDGGHQQLLRRGGRYAELWAASHADHPGAR